MDKGIGMQGRREENEDSGCGLQTQFSLASPHSPVAVSGFLGARDRGVVWLACSTTGSKRGVRLAPDENEKAISLMSAKEEVKLDRSNATATKQPESGVPSALAWTRDALLYHDQQPLSAKSDPRLVMLTNMTVSNHFGQLTSAANEAV
jgi:hypothetical protein